MSHAHGDSGSIDLTLGQRVRVAAWVRPSRYSNKVGDVVAVGDEIGVRLGEPGNHQTAIWFRPSELEVGGRPQKAPTRAATDDARSIRMNGAETGPEVQATTPLRDRAGGYSSAD